jgi:hypothetical protein
MINKFTGKRSESALGETKSVEVTDTPPANLSRYMIGTYVDPQSGEWMIAEIKFDPATKQVGVISIERAAGDVEVMRERFQIKVVNRGLFSRDPVNEDGQNALNLY